MKASEQEKELKNLNTFNDRMTTKEKMGKAKFVFL